MAESVYPFIENNIGDIVSCTSDTNNEPPEKYYGVKPTIDEDAKPKTPSKEKRLGHRRVLSDGGITYKRINTSEIIASIQLGIERSVGGMNESPERDVLMEDFMTVELTSFIVPDCVTSSFSKDKFIFKTYAPTAFRHFRDLFLIKPDNFVSSFCNSPLVELPNPGASGSVFYLTHNDEFITKTVQRKEAEFLQKLLPGYYLNLNQNPQTLLPKFFGLYCFKCGSKNVRLVVMNNVLPSSMKIHQKYDLKGSVYKRRASKQEQREKSPTLKDVDFIEQHPEGIFLDTKDYGKLMKIIQSDCRVLESFQIIDYSLLLGIHNVDQAQRESDENKRGKKFIDEEATGSPCGDGTTEHASLASNSNPAADNSCKLSSSIQERKQETEPSGYKNQFQGTVSAKQANGDNLLLFIGIIDILQSYRFKKKVEHLWKSIVYDGDAVSVHNPAFYAQRFQNFVANKVFKSTPLSYQSKRQSSPATISRGKET